MKAYYPLSTNEIIHVGKNGNVYKLDGIEKCNSLFNRLNDNPKFAVQIVKSNSQNLIQVGTDQINSVHNPIILESYKTGSPKEIAESSGIMWQPKLYNYAIEQALVSIDVINEAIQNNCAVAITGGGHHAEIDRPFGFCPINTMAIASRYAKAKGLKIAIIDLDTHYSNGCKDILRNDNHICVFSIWNQTLDKWKFYKSENNIWHHKVNNVNEYFKQLNILIDKVRIFKPDIIIYHLGLDVLETDRMGGVKGMTEEKLLQRDEKIRILIQEDLRTKSCIFIGGSYIDRTKGVEYAIAQKESATLLQEKILENYIH